ncbi:hypothetical protein GCM10027589_05000 [Actinocorallia lasiicapitis]
MSPRYVGKPTIAIHLVPGPDAGDVPLPEMPYSDVTIGGQANGLLGAAWPGALYLVVGPYLGPVPFRTELHDSRPAIPGPERDEVVDASSRPRRSSRWT